MELDIYQMCFCATCSIPCLASVSKHKPQCATCRRTSATIAASVHRPYHRYDEVPESDEVLALIEDGSRRLVRFDQDAFQWSVNGVVAWQYTD